MTGKLTGTLAGLMTIALVFGAGTAQAGVSAGAAKVDASWHVGAAAGQYAGDCVTDGAGGLEEGDPSPAVEHACAFGVDPSDGSYDPTSHAARRQKSYGIQSRLPRARDRDRGRRRQEGGDRQERPLHPAGPPLAPCGPDPRGQERIRHRARQPDHGGRPTTTRRRSTRRPRGARGRSRTSSTSASTTTCAARMAEAVEKASDAR